MTQVIVDEALLREPNLWTPKKKPIGVVKADSTHPLARGFEGVFFKGDTFQTRTGEIIRLPTKDTYSESGRSAGMAWRGGCYGNTDFVWKIPYEYGDSFSIVVVCEFTTVTSTSQEYIFSSRLPVVSSDRIYISRDAASSVINYGLGGDGTIPGSISCATGRVSVIGYTALLISSSSSDCFGYHNGVLDASDLVNSWVNTSTYREIGIGCWLSGGAPVTEVHLYSIMCWNRGLTADEHAALALDPYQFLIPA